jgi:DNA-binding response OmpR family regulator
VLVVEDDTDLLLGLAELLRARGAEVLGAADLRTARSLVRDHGAPDLLLADFDLPDGHGASFARELCAAAPSTRAVALTGHDEPEALDRSHEAGFVAHLVKPIDASALVGALMAAVRASATH